MRTKRRMKTGASDAAKPVQPSASRSIERKAQIAAPPEVVWKALTDAEELTRWFPLEARVTSGRDGSIWMRWNDASQSHLRVDGWTPLRHLRTVGHAGVGPAGGSVGIATDYYLEDAGGSTILRVVSSGFGAGEGQDDLLESFGYGWDFELCGLRHYLERHRGRQRRVASVQAPYADALEEAWEHLTRPGGWFGPRGLASLAAGSRYEARTLTDHLLAGIVQACQPPRQFVGTVEGWNDALFRIELKEHIVSLWLSTYEVPATDVRSLECAWREPLLKYFLAGT